jgi:hypothetical protein
MTTRTIPTASYKVLHAIRLTGRFVDEALQIRTVRDIEEVVVALEIAAHTEALPVRVECYDFTTTSVDPATGVETTTKWCFRETGPWIRGSGDYAYAEFGDFSDGNVETLSIVVTPEGTSSNEDDDEPVEIYIKIEPLTDGGPGGN